MCWLAQLEIAIFHLLGLLTGFYCEFYIFDSEFNMEEEIAVDVLCAL